LKPAGYQGQTRPDGQSQNRGWLFPNQFHRPRDIGLQFIVKVNACFHSTNLHPKGSMGKLNLDVFEPAVWTRSYGSEALPIFTSSSNPVEA
jgi:hypothetical protein